MSNTEYKPRPFTEELAEDFKKEMLTALDDKRTLCNVLKLAYRNAKKESHNLAAVRALMLEALWMGQRMSDRLSEIRKLELHQEYPEQVKDDPFGVDWTDLSRGNWD